MTRQQYKINSCSGINRQKSLGTIPVDGFYDLKNFWSKPFLGAVYPAPSMFFKIPNRQTTYKTTATVSGKTRGLGYINSPSGGKHILHTVTTTGGSGASTPTTKVFTIKYVSELASENWISLCLTGTGLTTTKLLLDSICTSFTAIEGDLLVLSYYDVDDQSWIIASRIYMSGVWIDMNAPFDISNGWGFNFNISNPGRPAISTTWTLTGNQPPINGVQNLIKWENGAEHFYGIPYNLSITTLLLLTQSLIANAVLAGYSPTNGDILSVSWRDNTNQTTKQVVATYSGGWGYTGDTTQAVLAGDAYEVYFNNINPAQAVSFYYPYVQDYASMMELDITANAWKEIKPPLIGTNTNLTGTLTFTGGSTAVTGSGTAFLSEVSAGQYIRRGDAPNQWYLVSSVTNNTALVLNSVFGETTGAGTAGNSEKYDFNPYQMCYETYLDKIYSCGSRYPSGTPSTALKSAGGAIRKWDTKGDWSNAPYIRDRGSTTFGTITGTLTFTQGDATVSGATTAFTTELEPGDWITIDSTAAIIKWYEVKSITSDTELELMENYAEGTGAVATCKFAYRYKLDTAMFILSFKDRLWAMTNDGYPILYASIVGDFEDFSSATAYALEFPMETTPCGIAKLNNYLFVFFSNKYYVYNYTGDENNPIEESYIVYQGCVSHRTICNVGNALIYFSGDAVRMTNGASDVSISNSIESEFLSGLYGNLIDSYFSLTASDDNYPFAVFNNTLQTYNLYFPNISSGRTISFVYDITNQNWISTKTGLYEGHGIMIDENTSTDRFVWSQSQSSNQLYVDSIQTADYSVMGEALSGILDFGYPNKSKRIYSMEIKFYMQANTNVNLTLSLFEDPNDIKFSQSYNLTEDNGNDNTYKIVRFNDINADFFSFQYKISEISNTGQTGWGIESIVFDYEMEDNP